MRPTLQLGIAFVLFLAAIGGYGVWHYLFAQEQTKLATLTNQIATQRSAATHFSAAELALTSHQAQERELEGYFVSQNNIVNFISALQAKGTQLGSTISVQSVSDNASGGSNSSGSNTLTISATVQGTFSQVMQTIGAVEYMPYDITVPAVSISHGAGNGAGSGAPWSAQLTLTVGTFSGAPVFGTATSTTASTSPVTANTSVTNTTAKTVAHPHSATTKQPRTAPHATAQPL